MNTLLIISALLVINILLLVFSVNKKTEP